MFIMHAVCMNGNVFCLVHASLMIAAKRAAFFFAHFSLGRCIGTVLPGRGLLLTISSFQHLAPHSEDFHRQCHCSLHCTWTDLSAYWDLRFLLPQSLRWIWAAQRKYPLLQRVISYGLLRIKCHLQPWPQQSLWLLQEETSPQDAAEKSH